MTWLGWWRSSPLDMGKQNTLALTAVVTYLCWIGTRTSKKKIFFLGRERKCKSLRVCGDPLKKTVWQREMSVNERDDCFLKHSLGKSWHCALTSPRVQSCEHLEHITYISLVVQMLGWDSRDLHTALAAAINFLQTVGECTTQCQSSALAKW